jgi:serine/threonine protein phosphatase PrpC
MGEVSFANLQGARPRQEDRWIASPISTPLFSGHLLAVFDGHGGESVAEKARALLPSILLRTLTESSDVSQALRAAIAALAQATEKEMAGSTASVALVSDSALAVAVLGDSPIAWLNSKNEFQTVLLHNARTNIAERERAQARGAVYTDGYLEDPMDPRWQLQMSRALGDASLRRILERSPDVYQATPGAVLLLTSDGILSPGAPVEPQLRGFIDDARRGATADTLAEDAVRRRTGDNVTVVLWRATV